MLWFHSNRIWLIVHLSNSSHQNTHQTNSYTYVTSCRQWRRRTVVKSTLLIHHDVIKWKLFSRYWPFVRGIHRWIPPPPKRQWRGSLIFFLICAWINGWVNNREAGDLRRNRAHYDVIVVLQMNAGRCFLRRYVCNKWNTFPNAILKQSNDWILNGCVMKLFLFDDLSITIHNDDGLFQLTTNIHASLTCTCVSSFKFIQ